LDISLLRTFIEVARQRHFGRAADKLHITQSAVSARIKLLESTLGLELFSRKRNDIQLTPSGQRLLPHAETLVNGWRRVRQELALEPSVTAISVGFTADLWQIGVRDWVLNLRQQVEEIALQLESAPAVLLSERVAEGALDLAFLFDPPQTPGTEVRQLFDVPLRLVSSQPGLGLDQAFAEGYILVDWGIGFGMRHAALFGDRKSPRLRLGSASLAKEMILLTGGSAYLSEPSVEADLQQGRLHPVAGAPVVSRGVFAIHRSDREDEERLLDYIGRFAPSYFSRT
jgi:DNA-binding transcriptional LysR family regulator